MQSNPTQTSKAAEAVSWAMSHMAEMEWISDNMGRNDFAAAMARSLDQYGALTDRQLAAIRRSLTAPAAVEVDVSAIEERFTAARENQVKKPAMRLDTFVFKYAGDAGRNPGAIYVTDSTTKDAEGKAQYLGKVLGGKFLPVAACTDDQKDRIQSAAANPDEAARAYGQRTGNCSICGRELTAEESIERFIGPICASKYRI